MLHKPQLPAHFLPNLAFRRRLSTTSLFNLLAVPFILKLLIRSRILNQSTLITHLHQLSTFNMRFYIAIITLLISSVIASPIRTERTRPHEIRDEVIVEERDCDVGCDIFNGNDRHGRPHGF